MERRSGPRVRTDLDVIVRVGSRSAHCRGVELSSNGILIDQPGAAPRAKDHVLVEVEVHLPERGGALRALARPVWSSGAHQGLHLVSMSDVDRLTLAEHMDLERLSGAPMQ